MTNPIARIETTIRDVRRARHILAVFLKYGFGDLLGRLPLEGSFALGVRTLRRSPLRAAARLSRAERVRCAFEELGPTFVKFGQLLAERPDIVPPDFTEALAHLCDEVPPMPWTEARATLEAELGQPVDGLFAELDETPVAAASIAQVHRGVLADGRVVAVKIQRTDIEPVIAADLAILRYLAGLTAGRVLSEKLVDPVGLVDEFGRLLERETDFRHERGTMRRFAADFDGDASVHIPKPVDELSSRRVLTMEFIDGARPAPTCELEAAGYDPKLLARRGAAAFVRMALEHGHFHADPHGGNLRFLPGNVVAFLDFGAVGRLDPVLRGKILDLVLAIAERDHSRSADLFFEIGHAVGPCDRRQLEDGIADFVDDWSGRPLAAISVKGVVGDFFEILRKNAIRFPADLVVFARALVSLDAEGKRLDPGFDMISELREPIGRLVARRSSPVEKGRRFLSAAGELGELLASLPREMQRVLGMIERKDLEVRLSHVGLEGLVREIDRASNRLAFGLIVAALIVGSAIVSSLARGPYVWGYPAVGVLGFLLAGLLGLWLVLAMLRGGKL